MLDGAIKGKNSDFRGTEKIGNSSILPLSKKIVINTQIFNISLALKISQWIIFVDHSTESKFDGGSSTNVGTYSC